MQKIEKKWFIVLGIICYLVFLNEVYIHGDDIRDNRGWTALMYAANNRNTEMIKVLLESGSDINAKNNDGQTALMLAAINGYENVVSILIENEAEINAVDAQGVTALSLASTYGHIGVVEVLLQNRAEINASNNKFSMALMGASLMGHMEIVKLLLDKGANINAKDELGQSALWGAACKGNSAVVKLLIEKGADIQAKDNKGQTPSMCAARYGYSEAVNLLEDIQSYEAKPKSESPTIIRDLQKKLMDLGYAPGPIDGIWGGKTENALKKFQQDNDLFISGNLDKETKERLRMVLERSSRDLMSEDSTQTEIPEFVYLTEKTEYYETIEPASRYPAMGPLSKMGFITMRRSDALGDFPPGSKLEVVTQGMDSRGMIFLEVKNPGRTAHHVWIEKTFNMSFSDPRVFFKLQSGNRETGYLVFTNSEYYYGTIERIQFDDEDLGTIILNIKDLKELSIENERVMIMIEAGGEIQLFKGKFTSYSSKLSFVPKDLTYLEGTVLNQRNTTCKLIRDEKTIQRLNHSSNTFIHSRIKNFVYPIKEIEYYGLVEPLSRPIIKGRYGMPDMVAKRDDRLGYFQAGSRLEVLAQNMDKAGYPFLKVAHPDKPDEEVWIEKTSDISFVDPRIFFELQAARRRKFNGYLVFFDSDEYLYGSVETVLFENEASGLITPLKIHDLNSLTIEDGKITISLDKKGAIFQGKFANHYNNELLFISDLIEVNLNQKERTYNLTRTVKLPVEASSKANAQVNGGNIALKIAPDHGYTEPVKVLIDANADMNTQNKNDPLLRMDAAAKGKLLINAALDGDIERVKLLIDADADVNAQGLLQSTALKFAASDGNTEIVKLLIDAGADVNTREISGATALVFAAKKGNTETVKVLIDAGADVNARDTLGTALIGAARNGHTETVKALIDAGATVNPQDRFGVIVLIDAAQNNHAEMVKLLIGAGADVNAQDHRFGYTALEATASKGDTEMVKLLINAGADVNAQDKNGNTILRDVASKGHVETVKLLIDAGADVNAQTTYGDTALIDAASKGHAETVKLLIDAGADVNAQTRVEDTALIESASKGYAETVKLLIDAGADVSAQNKYGDTAMRYATSRGYTKIVQMLKAARAQK